MASIHYGKIKSTAQVKAWLRHCDSEQRLIREHKNEHIDKSKISENINFMCLSYEESCERFSERIKELDNSTNRNKRKDRVQAFGLCISMPQGLNRENETELMKETVQLFEREYGKENLVSAIGHYDEVHEYVRDTEVRKSRGHLHIFIIPEIKGQLCGKKFSSKNEMKRMNREIDKICYERFGIHFLTGEKAMKKSVEELKADGKEIERLYSLNRAIEKKCMNELVSIIEKEPRVLELVSEAAEVARRKKKMKKKYVER